MPFFVEQQLKYPSFITFRDRSLATNSGISSTAGESASFSSDIDKLTDIDRDQFQLDQGQGITLDIYRSLSTATKSGRYGQFRYRCGGIIHRLR